MKNPKIRYYLEAKNSDVKLRTSQELIMAEISYGYSRVVKNGKRRNIPFRISLEATIQPNNFGDIKSNYKFNKDVFKRYSKSNATIKTKMNLLEMAINKLTNNYLIQRMIPNPEEFKNDLKLELGRNERLEEAEHGILDYLYEKINRSEKESEMSKRNSLSPNTIKTYTSVSHLIENYQLASKNELTFENFNKTKYWEFWDVMDDILKDEIKVENPNQPKKQRKQDYGYLVTTLRKYQSTLIRALKDAKEDDEFEVELALNVYDKNLILEKQDAKKDIYINEQELQTIIDTDVEFDKNLQMAKEYMIIGSLTGMRYESMHDTKNTKVESYIDDGYDFVYIHSKQFKTSTEVYMPLLALVKDILMKHNNKFPVVQTNATINSKLKKLFRFLEIDSLEDVTLKTYRSGVIKLTKPKHEIVTTHDCKKTFYTNLYNNKVNPTAIDNMTHPDASTKNRMAKIYNKANMLDKAKMFVDEINKANSKIYKM